MITRTRLRAAMARRSTAVRTLLARVARAVMPCTNPEKPCVDSLRARNDRADTTTTQTASAPKPRVSLVLIDIRERFTASSDRRNKGIQGEAGAQCRGMADSPAAIGVTVLLGAG